MKIVYLILALLVACASDKESKQQREEEELNLNGVWKVDQVKDSCSVMGNYRGGELQTGAKRINCSSVTGFTEIDVPNLITIKHDQKNGTLDVDHEGLIRRIQLDPVSLTGFGNEALIRGKTTEIAPGCFVTWRVWNSVFAINSTTIDYSMAISVSNDTTPENPDACSGYLTTLGKEIAKGKANQEYMSFYRHNAFDLDRINEWWIGWVFVIYKARKIAE